MCELIHAYDVTKERFIMINLDQVEIIEPGAVRGGGHIVSLFIMKSGERKLLSHYEDGLNDVIKGRSETKDIKSHAAEGDDLPESYRTVLLHLEYRGKNFVSGGFRKGNKWFVKTFLGPELDPSEFGWTVKEWTEIPENWT